MTDKVCSKCKNSKPVEDFHRANSRPDGRVSQCKECKSAYYKANANRIKQSQRDYYTRNREAVLARQSKYNEENSESVAASKRQWREKNSTHIAEYARQYRETHRERLAQYMREYQQTARGKTVFAAARHRRRARENSAPGDFSSKELSDLFGSIPTCLACGSAEEIQADHVIPLCRGGSNDISNIQPLCKACNLKKGTNSTDYRGGE